ncbi:hypothetical protein ACFVU0_06450 [Streptomyces sp. NPDC058122]|uniref:hypothetical protein n=1 Tax=Streptomyces sp. NPDC058122 TaxID=3346349 RepID=UPI0036E36C2F
MDLEKPSAAQPVTQATARPGTQAEGCLAVAIRLPVRIVVLVLVVPVRMVWDALVFGGRFLRDTLFRPLGRALGLVLGWVARALFVWPWVALWRYVLRPVGEALARLGYVLLVVPAVWLYRTVLTPLGHALAWTARKTVALLAAVFSGALAAFMWSVGGVLTALDWILRGVEAVCGWVYARLLTPVGRAVARVLKGVGLVLGAVAFGVYTAVAWLARYLLVVPALWLYTWVLTPIGRAVAFLADGFVRIVRMIFVGIGAALYWTARVLLVLPALAVWRWILVPVGRALAVVAREIGEALGHAWRVAGYVSRAVGRFLARLFRWTFVEPARWAYRTVLTPVGHAVRDLVLRPAAEVARGIRRTARQALESARDGARQARADFRRMLFGAPPEPQPVARREPAGGETRTLGSSTTALMKD